MSNEDEVLGEEPANNVEAGAEGAQENGEEEPAEAKAQLRDLNQQRPTQKYPQ